MQSPHAPSNVKRYRINPIEGIIFLSSSLIFLNSLYHLFYHNHNLQISPFTPMSSSPISEGRSIASVHSQPHVTESTITDLHTDCSENKELKTTANKIRLNGLLCFMADHPFAQISKKNTSGKITIKNLTNKQEAIAFIDWKKETFITEYIQLASGENSLQINFNYNPEDLLESKNREPAEKKSTNQVMDNKIQKIQKTTANLSPSQSSLNRLPPLTAAPKSPTQ